MTLEIHRHSYISGTNANWSPCREVVHSHEGGDRPHEHEHTGPGGYTIDKDEWFAATGLRGGGRKKFTVRPTGPQLPVIPREPTSFDIIYVGRCIETGGPELAPAYRMILGHRARVGRVYAFADATRNRS